MEREALDANTNLFIIYKKKSPVGTLKITMGKSLRAYPKKEVFYIDEIYIKKEHTRNGIGKKALRFITLRAEELGKKVIWLVTMKNGTAYVFI